MTFKWQLSLALLFFYGIVYFYNVEPLYARCNLITEEGVFFQKLHGVNNSCGNIICNSQSFLTCVQLFSLFTFARLRHLNAHKLDVGCSTLTERFGILFILYILLFQLPTNWECPHNASSSSGCLVYSHIFAFANNLSRSHIFLNLLVITAYLVMHSIELNVYHTAVGEVKAFF